MADATRATPERGRLDKYAVNVSSPGQEHFSEPSHLTLRQQRWNAREAAQRLTHRSNLRKCGRVRIRTFVELRMGDDRASYGGLVTCGSVWLCAVCNAKIAAHRALEVAAVTEWAHAEGLGMYFGALTVQHGPTDALSTSLDTLRAAWRRMTQGRGWRDIVDSAGGDIRFVRALEINIGDNGWHPHMHPLVVLPNAGASSDAVAAQITRRWRQSVEACGGHASEAAQNLQRVERISDVGSYITDQTYGGKGTRVDLEMTSSQTKRGFTRAKGTRSHWSILESLTTNNADNAHYVSPFTWNEYAPLPHHRRR
ncbi:hypothetical protein [Microbacterium sediminicola]|uniref:hypothetical protein n=1 Tax=Microbacterium sediminicola TaxID=415210 RepID=UPI0031DC4B94